MEPSRVFRNEISGSWDLDAWSQGLRVEIQECLLRSVEIVIESAAKILLRIEDNEGSLWEFEGRDVADLKIAYSGNPQELRPRSAAGEIIVADIVQDHLYVLETIEGTVMFRAASLLLTGGPSSSSVGK